MKYKFFRRNLVVKLFNQRFKWGGLKAQPELGDATFEKLLVA
jgi:hypothetical protein